MLKVECTRVAIFCFNLITLACQARRRKIFWQEWSLKEEKKPTSGIHGYESDKKETSFVQYICLVVSKEKIGKSAIQDTLSDRVLNNHRLISAEHEWIFDSKLPKKFSQSNMHIYVKL